MDFTDTDLLACINSGHKTTSEIADEVGAKNTQQAAKALGVLKNQGLIAKNGQAQWFVIDDLATHEDMRTLYTGAEDVLDVRTIDSDIVFTALDALQDKLNPQPLPDFGDVDGLEIELETHLKLSELLDPSIAEVLQRSHARLLAIHNYYQAKAA
ncbi:MAG: hypothetical protein V7733_10415 [Paraglaciecola polaris]|uniref:hypothetical protein n=1 Tax=Paraglaciecola polaris TaxID=222814 RepID=UPI003000FF6C